MSIFKPFEKEVIRAYLGAELSDEEIEILLDEAKFYRFDSSPAGYVLECEHPLVHKLCSETYEHVTHTQFKVTSDKGQNKQTKSFGSFEAYFVGFFILADKDSIKVECFNYGNDLPVDFRDKEVVVEFKGI